MATDKEPPAHVWVAFDPRTGMMIGADFDRECLIGLCESLFGEGAVLRRYELERCRKGER